MYLNLNFNPYTIKETSQLSLDLNNSRFHVLTIGKDSYIVKAVVETGLNLDPNLEETAGVYNLQIGKYCSLAEDILFMIDINHDYVSVAQGCISEFQEKPSRMKLKRKGQILIENDVWIGHGATIMNGVTIHNGAIVAANATVTKDVPPYAIVAGNPAKIVKYRFSEEIIEKLLKISWWNWSSEIISGRQDDFHGDTSAFVKKYYEEAELSYQNSLLQENPVADINPGAKYLLIPDFKDAFPLYPKIIKAFCETFHEKDAELVIYLPAEDGKEGFPLISDLLESLNDYTVYVQIIDGATCGVEAAMANVNYYITDRSIYTLAYVELAEKYNTRIISGVDIPIFD